MPNLSARAIHMLNKSTCKSLLDDENILIGILNQHGYPVYQCIIDFEMKYADISYNLGNSNEGFSLTSIISPSYYPRTNISQYDLSEDIFKFNDEYYFPCAYYHYNESYYMAMDSKGRIHAKAFGHGDPYPIADSIEKFIEKDAIINYFLEKQPHWVMASFEPDHLSDWLNDEKYSLEKVEDACDTYTTFWKSRDDNVFISIQKYEEKDIRLVFTVSEDAIKNLFKNKIKVAVGYPEYKIYKFT